MNDQNKGKIVLHYDITMACNNRCEYCYCLEDLDNKKLINEPVFEDTIKAINEVEGDIIIDILGGEPLIVYERLFEFIERAMRPGITFNITSNINFKPGSKRMNKLIDFLAKHESVFIHTSWHSVNNQEYFRANLIELKDKAICIVLLADDCIEEVTAQVKFLTDNEIPFSVEPLYNTDHSSQLSDYTYYVDLQQPYPHLTEQVYMDGVLQDNSKREEFLTIAQNYKTICELSSLRISYWGEVTTICANPYKLGWVKDGIALKVQEIFCNGFHCRCSTHNYKRVLGWPDGS
mgnify:FL=1